MAFLSCEDVFENDISDDAVVLLSPAEGRVVETDSITFSWETIDDADDYQFQLRDELSNAIVIDSVLPLNTIRLGVAPSDYSWRVKAQNFGYETDFTFPRDLTVLLPDDLSNIDITLVSPVLDTYISSGPVTLSWGAIEDANSYSISVTTVQSGVTVEIISEAALEENIFNLEESSIENEGEYTWSVKAVNDVSESDYTFSRFIIDNTAPDTPVIIAPENDITVLPAQMITFNWQVAQDQGEFQSPISTFIEISDTPSFEDILINEMVDGQSFIYEIPVDSEELWWRVRFVDEADNQSNYSEIRRMIVE